jgi:hypothetical protein
VGAPHAFSQIARKRAIARKRGLTWGSPDLDLLPSLVYSTQKCGNYALINITTILE